MTKIRNYHEPDSEPWAAYLGIAIYITLLILHFSGF